MAVSSKRRSSVPSAGVGSKGTNKSKRDDGKAAPKVLKLYTPPFRLSFPSLYRPNAGLNPTPDKKPKFGCTAIWTPADFTERDKVLWRKILKELDSRAQEAFGRPWKNLPEDKRGIRNGAIKSHLAGYGDGTRFANMTSLERPGVIDLEGNDISPEEGNAHLIYPGCICRATINIFTYGTKKGEVSKGTALGLRNLQRIKDGPRLDNRVAAQDDFEDEVDPEWLDDDEDTGDEDLEDGDDGDDDEDDDESDFD